MRVKKLLPAAKYLCVVLICLFTMSANHPYYVSNTEINFNKQTHSVEITCRMFTDNLEDALEKTTGKAVDILHPKDKEEVEKMLLNYITERLKININGQVKSFEFIGYEREEDAIWTYLEIKEELKPKTVDVENSLLYNYLPQQMNMVHVTVDGAQRQSSKLTNPDKQLNFTF